MKQKKKKSPIGMFLSYFGRHKGLFAVDMAGKRLNEIPLIRKGGSLAAKLNVFQPSGAVFSYELTKQEHSGNNLQK